MKNKFTILIVSLILLSCKGQSKNLDNQQTLTMIEDRRELSYSENSINPNLNKDKVDSVVKSSTIQNNRDDKLINKTKQTITESFDHSGFDKILKKYVAANGNVNYKGIKENKATLDAYLNALNSNSPEDSWSKNDRLAFYMNAYNAMTLDLIINNYPTESIKDINDPWEQKNWNIDGKAISLEEIEHEILREMNEPRIHFGINCASISCPQLMNEAFTASKVEQQLEKLAIQFINDSKRNMITKNRVEISKIFRWFKEDFTKKGDIIAYLNKYSSIKINKDARIRYMNYNWDLNE